MKLLIKDKLLRNLLILTFVSIISSCSDNEIKNEAISDQVKIIPNIASIELYIENPIFQDITRSVVYKSDTDSVVFSTLESYDPDGNNHEFLEVSTQIGTYGNTNLETIKIENSREARSCTNGLSQDEFYCGTSLTPQIIKLNINSFSADVVYSKDGYSGWVHGIANDRSNNLYFIYSSNISLPEGVNKIDTSGDLLSTIPYSKLSSQTYGGVDLIDQNGNIWLWKGYPWKQSFLSPDGEESDRVIDGWSAEGYEEVNGNIYHIYTNKSGDFDKRKVVNYFSDEKFDNYINVDLQFRSNQNSRVVYFDQKSNHFYIYDKDDYSWSAPIMNQFGDALTEFMRGGNNESALLWVHPDYGQIKIIGATQDNEVIGWQYGRKSYFLLSEDITRHEIDVNNLSPSEITAISNIKGELYGAGNLTWSHIFSYSSGDLTTLKEAVPNNEGQIDLLFTNKDGYLYGMGYPDAIAFRYDPDLPWNPGNNINSNPKNCGKLDGQKRGIRGFNGSGSTFYLTASDYSAKKITALSKININTCSIIQRNDSEDSFPSLIDIVDLGNGNLLAIGDIDNSKAIMTIDKNNLDVVNIININGEKHTLFSSESFDKTLIGIDSSICNIENSLGISKCVNISHSALKIYELGPYILIFGLEDLTIVDYDLNIVNSYTSTSLGLDKFFPYQSSMHVTINNNEVYFSNYSSIYKITFQVE